MSKISETISELKAHVEELEGYAKKYADILTEEGKEKVNAVKDKTVNAINKSIDKIKDIAEDAYDEKQIEEFVSKVKEKVKEALDFTKGKIDDLANQSPKQDFEKLFEDIADDFDKVMQSDIMKKTADFFKGIGDDITNYLNKPEVKESINKVKTSTINAAEKGVEGLKKILKPADENKEEKGEDQQ